MKFRKENQQRFFEKIIEPQDLNDCWLMTSYQDRDGYHIFYHDGTSTKAHRYMYELYFGNIPKGQCVCHKCDNPGCVNPNHLFIGSHKDNMSDMRIKKRSRNSFGENNANTKLDNNQIIEMLNMVLCGKLLSKDDVIKYNPNFSIHNIQNILIKRNWSHIFDKYSVLDQEHIRDTLNGYCTREFVQHIKHEMLVNKKTNVEIEKLYGVTRWIASRIRNNKHKYS